MIGFDNLEIEFQTTDATVGVESQFQAVKDTTRRHRDQNNLDARWEQLPLEQKREIMRQRQISDGN